MKHRRPQRRWPKTLPAPSRRAAAQALIIDYGYGERSGFAETLQAVGGHRFADVLAEPGEDDLSAHVDFAALAAAGRRGGAAVSGPVTQGAFLANLGITERAEQLMKANPGEALDFLAATERLIGHDTMGRLFKALALTPARDHRCRGFSAMKRLEAKGLNAPLASPMASSAARAACRTASMPRSICGPGFERRSGAVAQNRRRVADALAPASPAGQPVPGP